MLNPEQRRLVETSKPIIFGSEFDREQFRVVQYEIAALFLPDVYALADLIDTSKEQVSQGGIPSIIITYLGPGMGKSAILIPMLIEKLRSMSAKSIPRTSNVPAEEINYAFSEGRGVAIYDEFSLEHQNKETDGLLVAAINTHTFGCIATSETCFSKEQRSKASAELNEILSQQGAHTIPYKMKFSGVPTKTAINFIDCFKFGDERDTLFPEILGKMKTITPRFLTQMQNSFNKENFFDNVILYRNTDRSLYDDDFDRVYDALGLKPDFKEFYRNKSPSIN